MSDDPIPVKPKRVMSELQLEKLKLAREKAHAVKQQMKQISDDEKIKHYEGKIKSIRKKETKEENAPENPPDDNEVDEEPPKEAPPPPPPKSKPKSKKKPVVIIEESDSDSSEDSNVVYIKRRGKKRDPAPPQQQQQVIPVYAHQPPNIPEPPPLRRETIMNPNPFYRHNVMPNYM